MDRGGVFEGLGWAQRVNRQWVCSEDAGDRDVDREGGGSNEGQGESHDEGGREAGHGFIDVPFTIQ
jgi:hypothetical protein